MKYRTVNELEHFEFAEAYIAEVRFMTGLFVMELDQVKILPENSCNRDIRTMRANGLTLTIGGAEILSFVEEGYKVYDADGKLREQKDDIVLPAEEYAAGFRRLEGCALYSAEKKDGIYTFSVDTEDHTFLLVVKGEQDTEEWDRFLNL